MTTSFLKSFIQEAGEFSLPADTSAAAPDAGVSPQAASAAITPAPAPAPTAGMPQFPSGGPTQPAVVNKPVLNKELILAVFSEMKSLISNYEKQLGSDEIPIEDAKIYINSLLGTLAFNAQKLSSIINDTTPTTPPVENGMTTPAAAMPPAPAPGMTEPGAALPGLPQPTDDMGAMGDLGTLEF